MNRTQRVEALKKAIKERVLVLDGAMGTALQQRDLTAEDFGGEEMEGCNENLTLTCPEIIEDIHKEYLKAGCDIIETNTFGGTPLVLDEFGLADKTYELNFESAQIALKSAIEYSTPEKPRFVAGSIGPTTKSLTITGGVTFDELTEHFYAQCKALHKGGADYFLIETCQDTRNIKSAIIAIHRLYDEGFEKLPIAVSGTIETMGTMLAGQSIEALYASVAHEDLLYLGINCATGPVFMTDHIRSLSKICKFPIACIPNAGLPNEDGIYLETPEMMCKVLKQFLDKGWVNVIGGCCGTQKEHIKAFTELAKGQKPRPLPAVQTSYLSGIEYIEVTEELRPIIVGERTNVIGSRKFKRLIQEEKFEEATEIARAQVKKGAQIIDVCLANPDREEQEDMHKFLAKVINKIKVPLMIDSTDDKVIEESLKYCQGKAIINSINLEDGEERFEKIVPLAKLFGAALVVGTIDEDPEQGMGVTRERKLGIAERCYGLLVDKYKIPPEDIYFDPLVFPCATGDKQYLGSAKETIEGLRLIRENFPICKLVLGVSNVSFGLPEAGREVLNSVFLHHCIEAGLDLAIVNSETYRYSQIPEEEIELANNLLFNIGEDPVADFANQFRDKKTAIKKTTSSLPLNKRIPNYILEGSRDGLVADLDEALKKDKPMNIINGPLMDGMDEVGRLFNANQLIVAEVLQSAEVMKAAVSHLEQFMEKKDVVSRGKIVLATVKGDVHDIGKNLVDIILSNNGFEVVNLGIKIPPNVLMDAVVEHKPDMVGLSGLLVKSAQQMVVTAEDFKNAGHTVPILVGGAALTSKFVDKRIAPTYDGAVIYAQDAMNGLDLAKKVVDPAEFEKLKAVLDSKRSSLEESQAKTTKTKNIPDVFKKRSEKVEINQSPNPAPDYKTHILDTYDIKKIWSYINPMMLYTRHLGIKAKFAKRLLEIDKDPSVLKELQKEDPKTFKIWETIEEIKSEYKDSRFMEPSAIYKFFKAQSERNKLFVLDESEKQLAELTFERQSRGNRLCLSDYINPKDSPMGNMAFFVVSVGKNVRDEAERLKNSGHFLKSHVLQALALESAEAYAEMLHSDIRKMWGFPDSKDMTMMERFKAKYRGRRYSFGYPACPRLEDQETLFQLLKPEQVGVHLTDGFMMDPEASVSAIVFQHPQAEYYSV